MSLLANYPFFFDSPEYVALSRMPIVEALHSAHPLAHPVSMLMWRIAYLGLGPSVMALAFVSLLFWVAGTMAVASCIEREKSGIFYLTCFLMPLPWLVMTNVGVDAVSSALFAGGVVIVWRQRSWVRVAGATLLLGLSILNYLGMVVWLPVPLMIILLDKKLSWKNRVGMAGVVMLSVMMGLGTLILMGLWTTKVGVGLASIPIAIYHAGVAFVANFTWVSVVLVLGFGVRWVARREWTKLMIMAIMAGIYVVSLVPWHSGPYGRLGLFLIYPLAWLYSRLPKWTYVVAIILILPSWHPIMRAYQGMPLPLLEQKLVDRSSCIDDQLVFSEIQRPQLSLVYPLAWYVGPANWQDVLGKIEHTEKVCISQQALDYPDRQFEGQLPYLLPGKKGSRGFLAIALQEKHLELVATEAGHPELTIYSISR